MKAFRIIAGSFWVVMAVHLAVFTAAGFLTSSWRLLIIFIAGFLAMMAVYAGIKIWMYYNPDRKINIRPLLPKSRRK